jgi:hypothetical protein
MCELARHMSPVPYINVIDGSHLYHDDLDMVEDVRWGHSYTAIRRSDLLSNGANKRNTPKEQPMSPTYWAVFTDALSCIV